MNNPVYPASNFRLLPAWRWSLVLLLCGLVFANKSVSVLVEQKWPDEIRQTSTADFAVAYLFESAAPLKRIGSGQAPSLEDNPPYWGEFISLFGIGLWAWVLLALLRYYLHFQRHLILVNTNHQPCISRAPPPHK